MQNGTEAHMFYWPGKREKFGDVLAEKKVTLSWLMILNMVKPEKFDHIYLVYHFTVPLMALTSRISYSTFNGTNLKNSHLKS